LSSLAAESSVFILLLINFRAVGWDINRMLPRVMRLVLLGVITAAAMLLLRDTSWPLALIMGLVIYAVGVFVLRVLATDDWDLLYRLLAALPGGKLILRYWKRDVQVNW
jgi:hypothetical protein